MAGFSEADFEPVPAKLGCGEGWALVLDDDNSREARCVARALCSEVGLGIDQAMEVLFQAERHGSAIVTITSPERARRLHQALASRAFRVSLRPC